jgi:VanZ family protein
MSRIAFAIWLLLVTAILCTPARTVRQANARVTAVVAVKAQSKTEAYKLFQSGDSWHAALFFILGILAMRLRRWSLPINLLAVFLLVSGYGFTIEVIQQFFIPGRSFQWSDLAVNEMGLILGLVLAGVVQWLAPNRPQPQPLPSILPT